MNILALSSISHLIALGSILTGLPHYEFLTSVSCSISWQTAYIFSASVIGTWKSLSRLYLSLILLNYSYEISYVDIKLWGIVDSADPGLLALLFP